VEQLWFRKAAAELGLIGCPNAECRYTVERSGPERERCECELCHQVFCTDCRAPYHYRSACDELVTLARQWLEWRRGGREGYLRQMTANDAAYKVGARMLQLRRSPQPELRSRATARLTAVHILYARRLRGRVRWWTSSARGMRIPTI
jgi:hypothetical protein